MLPYHLDLYMYCLSFLLIKDLILLRRVSKKFKKIVKTYGIYYLKQKKQHTHNCIIHKNILNNECVDCILGFAIILCYENIEPSIFMDKIMKDESLLINYINILLDLDKIDYLKGIYDIKKINYIKINKNVGCFISDKSFQFILKYTSVENNGKIYDIKTYDKTFDFINIIFNNINISLDAILNRFFSINNNDEKNNIIDILIKYPNDIYEIKNDFIKCIDRTYILLNLLK